MKSKRNSGFSMVEVIIALALIVLVSIASLTIALSSIATRVTIVNRTHAQNFADNVWECFKAAKDTNSSGSYTDEFWTLVYDATDTEPNNFVVEDSSTYEYKSEKHNFKIKITLTEENNRPKIDVSAFSTKNGRDKLIVDFDYTKGAN